jgi:hypothetical protein
MTSDLYLSAVTWIERGEYDRALRMLYEIEENNDGGVDKDVVFNTIGAVHMKSRDYLMANGYFLSAINERPTEQYYCNFSQSLMMQGKPEEALRRCREWFVNFKEEKSEQLCLRAHAAAHLLKRFKQADDYLAKAGDSPEAKALMGMRLMAGRSKWKKGVELYGARKVMYERYIPQSLEFVSNYRDITSSYQLNVILEQGLGDCIMMIPYILRLVTDYGTPVRVISLDGRHDTFIDDIMSSYGDMITATKASQRNIELEGGEFCWMFDLLDTVNGPVKNSGYIQVEQQIKDLAYWSKGMIGVCWRGNPAHNNDRFRSMNINDLTPILEMPNVISIQHDLTDTEKDVLMDHGVDAWDKKGLVSLAAVVSNLKAVVTVDTAMSHMAGALGTNCITMLPTNADWRWGDFNTIKGQSDFYGDNHALARQSKCGQWSDVVEYVKGELKNV